MPLLLPMTVSQSFDDVTLEHQMHLSQRRFWKPGETVDRHLAAWRDPAGEVLRTFTIATTAASEDMAGLHDRMPVILDPDAWPAWLGEEAGNHAELLRPAPAGTVRLWPVSRAVNSVQNNGPERPNRSNPSYISR